MQLLSLWHITGTIDKKPELYFPLFHECSSKILVKLSIRVFCQITRLIHSLCVFNNLQNDEKLAAKFEDDKGNGLPLFNSNNL